MHIANGVAQVNVTMTATYNGVTVNKVISFKVIDSVLPETESIADVINEEDGTSVCVKGIVMSSLVNQTGFYINDGTGVIAVRTTEKEMEGIATAKAKAPTIEEITMIIIFFFFFIFVSLYHNHHIKKAVHYGRLIFVLSMLIEN